MFVRRNLLILAVTFVCLASYGQQQNYRVGSIPLELTMGANAVVRKDDLTFQVLSKGKAVRKVHYAITILNKKSAKRARIMVGYDRLRKIKSLSANVYDADGRNIKKVRSNDFKDISLYDGFSVYTDNRAKVIDLRQTSYPYTIEVSYELVYDGLLFYPTWFTRVSGQTAVEESSFEVLIPKELGFRYKNLNISEPVTQESEGKKVYRWEVKNQKVINYEPYAPDDFFFEPAVFTAPESFEMGGFDGKMTNWKELGRWQQHINEGLSDLPDERKAFFRELVSGIDTKEEKLRKVYQYLQSNTRYVSVQLGIGGWRPVSASFVDKVGYGDCKALSFYTKSILEAVGIKSYYTLVRAGRNEKNIDKDFVSRQFNHVILAVPNEKDTTWLECTSQTNPFGYLGTFTGDRDVVMITEEGGQLVHTPKYTLKDNVQSRVVDVYLEANGGARASIVTHYGGVQFENNGLNFILNKGERDQKQWVMNNTDIPNFSVADFEFNAKKNKVPQAKVAMDLQLTNYASVSGKRLFMEVNLLNKFSGTPEEMDERKADVFLRYAYSDLDTIRYHIPEQYRVEYSPEKVTFESEYGSYSAEIINEEGQLTYIRSMKLNNGRFPANSYNDFVSFLKKVEKADKVKIVLAKST